MTDGSDRDSTAPWRDGRLSGENYSSGASEIEVVPDAESDTVTFVSRGTGHDTTTTWITVDAELVVNVAEQR